MPDVTARLARGRQIGLGSFADLTDVAPSAMGAGRGGFVVRFPEDAALTAEVLAAVQERMETPPE